MYMNVNQEKLDKFNAAIQHYALEQQRKIQEEIEALKQQAMQQAEDEALQEAYGMIQKEMTEMRNRISRKMAQRENEERQKLLKKRQAITEKVFQRAKEELLHYTDTADYPALLKRFAKQAGKLFAAHEAEAYPCILFLREKDLPLEAEIKAALNLPCRIQADPTIHIGGLRLLCMEKNLEADSTLDSLLLEQKDWFEEISNLSVY